MAHDESDGPDFGEDIPEFVKTVGEMIPIYSPDAEEEEAIKEMMGNIHLGQCLLCERKVGAKASAVVAKQGLIMLFCSGVCMTDMILRGWIEEIHGDMTEALEFRKTQPTP